MARQVVLHQEPGGGTIPDVHRGEAGEEGKLVMGSYPSAEQAGDHRDGASEARAAWPRWVAGLPYLLSPSDRPVGGENTPMWEYSGPMDPDRASPKELSRDEVWSCLSRVL